MMNVSDGKGHVVRPYSRLIVGGPYSNSLELLHFLKGFIYFKN